MKQVFKTFINREIGASRECSFEHGITFEAENLGGCFAVLFLINVPSRRFSVKRLFHLETVSARDCFFKRLFQLEAVPGCSILHLLHLETVPAGGFFS